MIARIAWGLARSTTPEHRWRRVAVPLATLIFMLLTFAAASIMVLVQREMGREAGRMALEATTPAPTDLLIAWGDDNWQGEQFSVIWIDRAGSGAPVLPPGMAQLPALGQAVVSPALDRLAQQQPSLAARYPNRFVLGREGIRSEGELFAYVRMPESRTLANDDRTMRVRAFGPPTVTGTARSLGILGPIPMLSFSAAVLTLLVVPGLIVLVVGVATASSTRDHRFGVLHWIGASSRTRNTLAVLETLLLALPGLVLGILIWSVTGPRLGQVPLVNHAIIRGDMGLPWWLLLAVLGVCLVVTALVTLLVTAVRARRGTARPRPTSQRATVARFRTMPLVVGLVVVALNRISTDVNLKTMLWIGGILILLVGVPLALPNVLCAIGTRLRQQASPAALMAGRGLEWDPIRIARPFAGIATLMTLVIAGGTHIAAIRQAYADDSGGSGPLAGTVRWSDPRSGDIDRLADAFGAGLVVPMQVRENDNTLTVGATCQQLVPYLSNVVCRADAPFELSEQASQQFAVLTGTQGMSIRLAARESIAFGGNALIFDDTSPDILQERMQIAAMQVLPVPLVASPMSFVLRTPWLDAWLMGGILVGAVGLTFGCLLSMVDRLLVTRQHRRHLLNLGVVPRRLALIDMVLFATPYVASVVLGVAMGLIATLLIAYGTDTVLPWNVIYAAIGVALVTGLVGTLSVAVFGARSALISRT